MVYANFDHYKNQYFGTVIPEEAFNQAVLKASRHIDYYVYGRISEENVGDFPTLPDCACEMAEIIYKTTLKDGKEKRSETTDGYSVTYVTEGRDGESADNVLRRKLYAIAETYLLNTGLLYLGC